MSRTGRLLVVAAAWAIPVAWIAVALLSGPSDGTAVSSIGLNEDQRWGRSVTVLETYGDTPLHEGDTILRVDRRSMPDWLDGEAPGTRSEGEAPLYEILRPGAGIDQNLEVEVPLGRYPWSDAVAENVSTLSVVVVLLVGASFVFWRRPTDVAGLWFLAGAVLVPAVLTSWPFGLGAADLAGSRGVWPQVVGEAAFCAGLGALLVAALAIGTPPGWFRRRPWVAPALVAVPFAGYALWVFAVASGLDNDPGRLDAFTTLAAPAAAAAVPALLLLFPAFSTPHRARRGPRRGAAHAAGNRRGHRRPAAARRHPIPDRRRPLVTWEILGPPLVAAVVASWVVALLRYRIDDIEPAVRRALVQALVATWWAVSSSLSPGRSTARRRPRSRPWSPGGGRAAPAPRRGRAAAGGAPAVVRRPRLPRPRGGGPAPARPARPRRRRCSRRRFGCLRGAYGSPTHRSRSSVTRTRPRRGRDRAETRPADDDRPGGGRGDPRPDGAGGRPRARPVRPRRPPAAGGRG